MNFNGYFNGNRDNDLQIESLTSNLMSPFPIYKGSMENNLDFNNTVGIMNSDSASVKENFEKLKESSKTYENTKKLNIAVPEDYIQHNQAKNKSIFAAEMFDQASPIHNQNSEGLTEDEYKFMFDLKNKGNISTLSGIMGNNHHSMIDYLKGNKSSSRLRNVKSRLKRNKSVKSRPQRANKSQIEEEIMEELFANKRKKGQFGDISNLSAIMKKKKRAKRKSRKSVLDLVDINLDEMKREMEKLKTHQTDKLKAQEDLINRSCQITKKGKSNIERMIQKNKNSMIYSEIESENEEEWFDTVKPLESLPLAKESIDKRKFTFGMRMNKNLMQNGLLDLNLVQQRCLEDKDFMKNIQNGICENYEEDFDPDEALMKAKLPRKQSKKIKPSVSFLESPSKMKNKKRNSIIIRTNQTKLPPKKSRKGITSKKNLNKIKNSRISHKTRDSNKLKAKKKKTKSSKKIARNAIKDKLKKDHKPKSMRRIDVVISRYGIPLLKTKEPEKKKSVQAVKPKKSKKNLKIRKKRNSFMEMNSTLYKSRQKEENTQNHLKIRTKKNSKSKSTKNIIKKRSMRDSYLESTLKAKPDKTKRKKKKRIKSKSFRAIKDLKKEVNFDSADEQFGEISDEHNKRRHKKKINSYLKNDNPKPMEGDFGPRENSTSIQKLFAKGRLVESQTIQTDEERNILIKGLHSNKMKGKGIMKLTTEEKLGLNKDHFKQVEAEYYSNSPSIEELNPTSNLKGKSKLSSKKRKKTSKSKKGQKRKEKELRKRKKTKGRKNDFYNRELIDKLRNEDTSDDEEDQVNPFSKNLKSRESNLMNDLMSADPRKKFKLDDGNNNTLINLNYSGDSDGFIDGNISEKYLSSESEKANKDRSSQMVPSNEVSRSNPRNASELLSNQNSKARKDSAQKASLKESLNNNFTRKPIEEEAMKSKQDLVNSKVFQNLIKGLNQNLSKLSEQGGLTGEARQNHNSGKPGDKVPLLYFKDVPFKYLI